MTLYFLIKLHLQKIFKKNVTNSIVGSNELHLLRYIYLSKFFE